jgi:hypothetical protein
MKKVSELIKGDVLISDAGEQLKIDSIGNGFYRNSLIVHYINGEWSCLSKSSLISVK